MLDVKISFNKAAAKARLQAASDHALSVTGSQALKDISRHVPRDQNTLKDSGLAHSDKLAQDGEITLRWDTPYAQYLFHGKVMHGDPTNRTYGPEKLKFTEALARMEWTKYAAEKYGKDWQTVFQKALGIVLRKETGK